MFHKSRYLSSEGLIFTLFSLEHSNGGYHLKKLVNIYQIIGNSIEYLNRIGYNKIILNRFSMNRFGHKKWI